MVKAMIDTTTQKPLSVEAYGGPPYMSLPATQLEKVTAVLDAHHIAYSVDEEFLSIDGKPEVAFIDFDRGTDPVMIQRLLDSIP